MKKIIFWVLGILVVLGLIGGLVFLLNSIGVIDLNAATSTLLTESPSGSSISAGGVA